MPREARPLMAHRERPMTCAAGLLLAVVETRGRRTPAVDLEVGGACFAAAAQGGVPMDTGA